MTPIELLPRDELKVVPHPSALQNSSVKINYGVHICQASLNMIGRVCVGIVVGICIAFACRNEVPYDFINVHIILCVVGVSIYLFFIYFCNMSAHIP